MTDKIPKGLFQSRTPLTVLEQNTGGSVRFLYALHRIRQLFSPSDADSFKNVSSPLQSVIARNMFLLEHLREFAHISREEGLLFVPIKGPILSLQLYNDLLRPASDLDIFCGEDYSRWRGILLSRGYITTERYPETFRREGIVIDLHPHLVNVTRVPARLSLSLPLEEKLGESEEYVEGMRVPGKPFYLDYLPAHNLFHHGFSSILDHIDFLTLYLQLGRPALSTPAARLNLHLLQNFQSDITPPSLSVSEKLLLKTLLRLPREKYRYALTPFFLPSGLEKASFIRQILFPPREFLVRQYGDGLYPFLLIRHLVSGLLE